MFEDAGRTFSQLLNLHEYLYCDMNQNHESKVIEDKKMILHRDIYFDYKHKLVACIFSDDFEHAHEIMIHLKKLANLLLSPFEQIELLHICFYSTILELNQYHLATETVQNSMQEPDYLEII